MIVAPAVAAPPQAELATPVEQQVQPTQAPPPAAVVVAPSLSAQELLKFRACLVLGTHHFMRFAIATNKIKGLFKGTPLHNQKLAESENFIQAACNVLGITDTTLPNLSILSTLLTAELANVAWFAHQITFCARGLDLMTMANAPLTVHNSHCR